MVPLIFIAFQDHMLEPLFERPAAIFYLTHFSYHHVWQNEEHVVKCPQGNGSLATNKRVWQ